ncbi:uncharacterized protein [Amphiura filiformis]|uniref:uncharacterized protein n=1 Tax=Amphiura filiformis TaxID=82378 RepID=UPI003B2284DB
MVMASSSWTGSFFLLQTFIVGITVIAKTQGQTTCQERLGVEDGRISDSQLTASTEFGTGTYHGANNARLNRVAQTGTTGAWSAQTKDGNQWIQAALGSPTWVTGVLIQGRADICCPQWVTKFKVQYSNDGNYWTFVRQTNNQSEMIFDGNTDQNTIVTNLLPTPVRASYIRIVPTAWKGHISMRFELVGCEGSSCFPFNQPTDGAVSPEKDLYNGGDIVTVYCRQGVHIIGDEMLICSSSGSWYGQTPRCSPAVTEGGDISTNAPAVPPDNTTTIIAATTGTVVIVLIIVLIIVVIYCRRRHSSAMPPISAPGDPIKRPNDYGNDVPPDYMDLVKSDVPKTNYSLPGVDIPMDRVKFDQGIYLEIRD